MKKILLSIIAAAFLAGCAASAYKSARSNADLVKNGMTVDQAIAVLGMAPSNRSSTDVEWRRGNAQTYDATPSGAIKFHLKDGLIADVPEGGIFGPEARRAYIEARNALRAEREAADEREQQANAAQAAAADERARARKEARIAQAKTEIAEELKAAAGANVACNEKSSCAKVFALAQIYIATETDQKIQVVTDTIIQTYNPTEMGKIGATIMKVPQRADGAVVALSLACKSGDEDEFGSTCRTRNADIYKRFRPFIEARLAH